MHRESKTAETGTKVQVARLISLVLHPFLIAPLAIMLILYLDGTRLLGAAGWAGLCAALVVIPVVTSIAYQLAHKQVTDADVSVREDRYIFYLLGAICLMICFAVLLWLNAPKSLVTIYTSGMLTILAFAFATRIWTKVSIHTGILGGMTATVAFFSRRVALVMAIGTVLVAWSRLVLRRHTPVEVASGLVIACTVAVITMAAS